MFPMSGSRLHTFALANVSDVQLRRRPGIGQGCRLAQLLRGHHPTGRHEGRSPLGSSAAANNEKTAEVRSTGPSTEIDGAHRGADQ